MRASIHEPITSWGIADQTEAVIRAMEVAVTHLACMQHYDIDGNTASVGDKGCWPRERPLLIMNIDNRLVLLLGYRICSLMRTAQAF